MADEKMKSGIARTNQKAAGGKAMVLEAEQVGRLFIDFVTVTPLGVDCLHYSIGT